MTSTEFTAGIVEGARVSSKVLKPPGGGSSDIFGLGGSGSLTGEAKSAEQSLKDASTHNRVFGCSELPPPPSRNLPLHQSSIFENGNEPAAPTPSKQKSRKIFVRRNPITGEETEICRETETDNNVCDNEEVKEESADVPSKPVTTSIRVRNPPGGKSSGIF